MGTGGSSHRLHRRLFPLFIARAAADAPAVEALPASVPQVNCSGGVHGAENLSRGPRKRDHLRRDSGHTGASWARRAPAASANAGDFLSQCERHSSGAEAAATAASAHFRRLDRGSSHQLASARKDADGVCRR